MADGPAIRGIHHVTAIASGAQANLDLHACVGPPSRQAYRQFRRTRYVPPVLRRHGGQSRQSAQTPAAAYGRAGAGMIRGEPASQHCHAAWRKPAAAELGQAEST